MMDQAVTRAAGATPSTTPPAAAARRSWSILLTSANHGTVGPLGSTFPHAGEHHERVVVVEVPAGADAPSDQVNLVLRAAPAAQADQVAPDGLHDAIMRIPTDPNHDAFTAWVPGEREAYLLGHRDARHAAAELAAGAEAGRVATPEYRERLANIVLHAGYLLSSQEYLHAANLGKGGLGFAENVAKADARFRAAVERLAAAPSAPAEAQQVPAQAALAPAESIECWSHNEEDFNAKSLGELIDDHELEPGATVWVGEAVHPEPKSLFSTDWLIENMGEAAYDIAGEHAGEDYPNVSDEQVAELEALIVGWIAKCAPPNFWTVKNVRPYVLTAEDCGAQASTAGERQEGGQS